jgi:hypothetical protein
MIKIFSPCVGELLRDLYSARPEKNQQVHATIWAALPVALEKPAARIVGAPTIPLFVIYINNIWANSGYQGKDSPAPLDIPDARDGDHAAERQ